MKHQKISVVFSPDIISLLWLRLTTSGPIYFTETGAPLSTSLLKKTSKLLYFLNIHAFKYHIGTGSQGQGYLNSIFCTAKDLTEEFTNTCNEINLINNFSEKFFDKNFLLFIKKYIYLQIWHTIRNYHGILNNYALNSIIYIPPKSCESFVFEKYTSGVNHNLTIKTFSKRFNNILLILIYFCFLIKRMTISGFKFSNFKKAQYKIMIECDRWTNKDRTFDLLEWWDDTSIKKEEILIFSPANHSSENLPFYYELKNKGFSCTELKAKRKIPISHLRKIISLLVFFPLKNIPPLVRSSHCNIFLFFLTQFFYWSIFFYYHKVKILILSNPVDNDYQTIICNLFNCSTIAFHTSYFGTFDQLNARNYHVNHLLLWGEAQINPSIIGTSVDHTYFTGCHALTNVCREKKILTKLNIPGIKTGKKNILFFDNTVINDAPTTEEGYFQFLEMLIQCKKILNTNVIYRPKILDPFDESHFSNTRKLTRIKKTLEDLQIPILTRDKYDLSFIFSAADIVVSNMTATPSMIALMLDIPSFFYFKNIKQTPDPIMRNYLNELIFEDPERLIKKIKDVSEGAAYAHLSNEEKKKINYHLDTNGLIRLRSIITEITNHS
ncbi:MAG: hypothetical protein UU24_C0006G0025 [Candidatus Nomurabacteria bacterium GW2011_GWA2_40_9]|uniref:Uncharacterized protein n=1 Tax=Candidatus Nomurabacteria bacterium GW2011_GWA2_40_9 TaxID=1618734 RepID=A0A0G0TXF9_9BACT|nr:MAG: hypothetical protein UU24_C0006G0025 [Candidatus Nomurabacteria bacterium GW2011_GWA2_40_9]